MKMKLAQKVKVDEYMYLQSMYKKKYMYNYILHK